LFILGLLPERAVLFSIYVITERSQFLRSTSQSSGILRIDLQSGYHPEDSIQDPLWLFWTLDYAFQSNQHPVFRTR